MGGTTWGKWGQGKTETKMGRKRDLVIQNRIRGGERKERVSRKGGERDKRGRKSSSKPKILFHMSSNA
jgi:hypothetical protein